MTEAQLLPQPSRGQTSQPFPSQTGRAISWENIILLIVAVIGLSVLIYLNGGNRSW